jgi:hypothetical protein
MAYDYDEQIVSDLHKDARGFRPSQDWWSMWKDALPAGKQLIWDNLLDELDAEIERDRQEKDQATLAFEAKISEIRRIMRCDRNAAIQAYVASLDIGENAKWYGASYICFEAGLPYSMSQVFMDAGAATHIG